MLDANLNGKLDYAKRDEEELGWKLFVLRLSSIILDATIRLSWLAALIWAFSAMLETINHK